MSKIPKPIRIVAKPVYLFVQKVYNNCLDMYDTIRGKRNPLVPKRNMIFIGDGDYQKIGNEFFEYFKGYGKITPESKVLDIGCGTGRMSLPLINYLSKDGQYYGFDIAEMGINWCKENISSRYPNFHFEHSNIFNKWYNPKGVEISSKYNFKYNDGFFDFVFLTSVFTHMYAQDVDRYLEEISRVMKKNSRCLITFFLLNPESTALIADKKSTQNLIYKVDEFSYAINTEVPEYAIGFNEDYVKKLFFKNGLNIIDPILYGSWCGRKKFTSYQDIIIAEKL